MNRGEPFIGRRVTRDHRRLAAIVSADVVGYSVLMGRDESATLAALKAHRRELIDPKITEYGGASSRPLATVCCLSSPASSTRCAAQRTCSAGSPSATPT